MYDLTGQVALVTGAAQGIGFGIALELARAGSYVVIADRDLPKAGTAAEEIKRQGLEASASSLDVTDEASVRACVQTAIQRLSRIDILVNNAGIHCEKLGQLSTMEHFDKCFGVNLFGVWRITRELLPHFKAQGSGKIINIASINGRKPWADTPAYSASKAAVINLTQSLAITLGADRINVNAVCPGGVMTAMADQFKQERPNIGEGIIRSRLLKRALLPEDIGRAVVFFASPQARNITGQALNVDGGAVMT
jgi:NAD(P)-dependent dehydrogenase (short-subunit alcohol dehydrogenase family)